MKNLELKLVLQRGEIFKNISLILVQNGQTEERKKAVAEAKISQS
jgi:hypothetical protein